MAVAPPPAPRLRPTDFLPKPFSGEVIEYDICHAHFLSFFDYLLAHDLDDPGNDVAALANINTLFRTTLVGKARLWAEGKVFNNIQNLRDEFLQRFSPSHSNFGNVKYFNSLRHTPGDSAEQTLNKIRLAAQRINYGNQQIRDKFLQSLPDKCQAAVIMSAPPDANAQVLAQRAQQYFDFSPEDVVSSSSAAKQVTFDQVHLSQILEPTLAQTNVLSELSQQVAQLQSDLNSLKLNSVSNDQSVNYHHSQSQDRRSSSPYPPSPGEHVSRQSHRHRSSSGDRDHYKNRSNSRSRGYSRSPYRGHQSNSRYRSNQSPRRSYFKCHFCGKPGHKWRDCYTYNNMVRQGINPSYFPHRPASGPPVSPPGQFYDSAQPYPFPPSQSYQPSQRQDFH